MLRDAPVQAAPGGPLAALEVLSLCLAEARSNLENGDSNAPADVAADIVRVLGRVYLGADENV